MAAVAAIATVAIAAGGTAYSIDQGNKSRQAQADQARKQEENQVALENERLRKEALAQQTMTKDTKPTGFTPKPTVISSPLGAPGQLQTANKTLIGS